MKDNLLPCPFCGGEAKLDEYCGKYVVFCKNASCSWRKTKAEAIEVWNTRHERTCEGCKHHISEDSYYCKPCSRCARGTVDFYEPKED